MKHPERLRVEWHLWWFGLRRVLCPWLLTWTEFFALVAAIFLVIVWLSECDDRSRERRYRAWELINSAAGLPGDGGRSDALENLARDGRSLAGAVLEEAHLPEISLRSADLSEARMKKAQLYGANLEDAVLTGADLRDANLSMSMSCPDTANRWPEQKFPWGACAEPTKRRTSLRDADLSGANLQGTDLSGADLKCAKLQFADLRGVRNLTQDQLNATFGGKLTLLPHHDDATVEEGGPTEAGIEVLDWPCHWQIAGAAGRCSGPQEQPECDQSVLTIVHDLLAKIVKRMVATQPSAQEAPQDSTEQR